MAERKWMDSILLPKKQREDFNDEYHSIASKVAEEWLLENKYSFISFQRFLNKVMELELLTEILKLKGRKHVTPQKGFDFLLKKKEVLFGLFGEKLETLMEYEKAIRQLNRISQRDYAYFGVGPDFIVKKNHEVFFVNVIVNQAKPKKYSGASFKIATEHGFRTMVLKLDVEIKIGETSLMEI